MLPRINIRRTYLIARRDFLGYIKTWGFWISFLMPFLFAALAFAGSKMDINVDPVRYETILDVSGEHAEAIKEYDLRQKRSRNWRFVKGLISAQQIADGKPPLKNEEIRNARNIYVSSGLDELSSVTGIAINKDMFERIEDQFSSIEGQSVFVDPPVNTLEEIKPYLLESKEITVDGEPQILGSVLYIYTDDETGMTRAELWSKNITDVRLGNLGSNYFRSKAQKEYLSSAGLSSEELNAARSDATDVQSFNPSKTSSAGGQEVTEKDMVPFAVAVAAAAILWLTVFSGAYMLLTSMLEEKLNKLMEMMLSTTRFSEIMLGKLLGVAALTITAMLPYFIVGFAVTFLIAVFDPGMTSAIIDAVTPKLLVFFPIFLVLGYIFYGALFIAMGSLAESMQDAQTLTTPIMLVLTACILVVPMGIRSPDSPILAFASWFPLSAPFAAIARLPSDPPWWQLGLSAFFLFLMSILVIWLASRILRFGVLSGTGVKGVTSWFKRVILRRKA